MLQLIVLSDADVDELQSALFTDDGCENFAVLFCGPARTKDGLMLLCRNVLAAPASAYRQRLEYHLEIQPAFLNDIVNRAKASGLSPVIAHSHPFANTAQYSSSDDYGEKRLLPVLGQLLPEFHPASLLMTPRALAARRVERGVFRNVNVAVRGRRSKDYAAVGESKNIEDIDSVERQVRAIGRHGQGAIRDLRVGIVGLGGTGSAVAEELCRLGVADISLVDYDRFEQSNLSRMWGSEAQDLQHPTSKARIVHRHLKKIRPSITLNCIEDSVVKQTVLEQLRDRHLIFGCTDNHLSRAVLNRFAYQYLIPVVDMGIRIDAREGRVASAAGRVSLVGAGLTCLRCSRHIDPDTIRAESLPTEERRRLALEGYVQGDPDPAPAVVSLNTMVASLAVTTALQMFVNVTGGDAAVDQIYDARSGTLFRVLPRHDQSCDVCSSTDGVKGLGDKQIVSAY
jgi:molybdopterin/thiamine biosynthesis adenylyltransferase